MTKLEKAIDSKSTTTIDEEAETARVSITVKEDGKRETQRYRLNWILDFSTTSKKQLLELASKSLVIVLQGRWRNAQDQMNADIWDNKTFDVSEVLASLTRKKKKPITKDQMENALSALSEDERKALIEKFL